MRRAQTWVFDYLAGFLMFVFLLFLSINLFQSIDARSDFDVVSREVDRVSVSLMSEGFPHNWSSVSVASPGILSDGKVNLSKLALFDSLGYSRSKSLMQVTGEYLFYFKNESGVMSVGGLCVRGMHPAPFDCIVPEVSYFYEDLAWTERIVVLDSKIVSLVVVVWR